MRRQALILAACIVTTGAIGGIWWLTRGADAGQPTRTASSDGAERAETPRRTAPTSIPTIEARPFDVTQDPVAAPESEPVSNLDGFAVIGKVIDDRRRPLAGASIEVVINGRKPFTGKSGRDGRFRIGVGAKPLDRTLRGAVHALDARGHTGLAALPSEPVSGDVDVGMLSLGAGDALTVRVLKDGTGVAQARVFLGKDEDLGFGPFITDAHGAFGPRILPVGSYVVTAFSEDLTARSDARVDVPRRGGAPLEVVLEPAWQLDVLVKDALTGRPAVGQGIDATNTIRTGDRQSFSRQVKIPGPIAPTGVDGKTRILGLSREHPVAVEIVPPGLPSSQRFFMRGESGRATAKPGVEEVVITMGTAEGETFSFPIVPDETDGPPDGAEVKLSVPSGFGGAPPPARGKVVGRNLVIEHVTERHFNFLATAEDGSVAIVRILGDARKTKVGSEAKFKKLRALVVTAHDRKGTPLTGYLVQCRTPGNVPIGSEATIAANGSARIEGLPPERVDVAIWGPAERFSFGRTAAAVDLTKPGDGRVDLVLERERRCVLHVTVDGEKRFPPTISVQMAAERGIASLGSIGAIEEDPFEATLRFSFRPDPKAKEHKFSVFGKGCPSVAVPLALPTDEEATIELAAALITGATIRLHVVPPSDNTHSAGIEAWNAERSMWASRGFRPMGEEMGKNRNDIVIDALPAGRYRPRDSLTGVVGEPIEVAEGKTADLTLDLSRAGVITGRVEGPADAGTEMANVEVEGASVSFGPFGGGGQQVRVNSEFTVRVPGDRPVTLRVKHPLLTPAAEGGSATVTAPGTPVVLKLVRGAEAVFRVAREQNTQGFGRAAPRVLLFQGDTDGEPVQACTIRLDGSIGRFGGYKPGKYTLWFDLPPAAPLVLEDVELGDGLNDLGELQLAEGATLRVAVLVREGQEIPRVDVSAKSIGRPEVWRQGSARGKAEVLVPGLALGRFNVEVRSGDMRSAPTEHEVESTGSGEVRLTVDLR